MMGLSFAVHEDSSSYTHTESWENLIKDYCSVMRENAKFLNNRALSSIASIVELSNDIINVFEFTRPKEESSQDARYIVESFAFALYAE